MARYPELSNLFYLKDEEVKKLYTEIQRWGATLLNELDARDAQVDSRPSTTIRVPGNKKCSIARMSADMGSLSG